MRPPRQESPGFSRGEHVKAGGGYQKMSTPPPTRDERRTEIAQRLSRLRAEVTAAEDAEAVATLADMADAAAATHPDAAYFGVEYRTGTPHLRIGGLLDADGNKIAEKGAAIQQFFDERQGGENGWRMFAREDDRISIVEVREYAAGNGI